MLRGTRRSGGQALIEFALVLPLLFLLILNLVNFGAFLYDMIAVANAARTGAQYMIMRGAWAGGPAPASDAAIIALVKNDFSTSVSHEANLVVTVCRNNNGVLQPAGCSAGGLSDPEAGFYVLGTVDVTYPYQPVIPFWNFSSLGIHLTLPPTTLHRRAVMRLVQ
jgi:Flp pilus assembly protein TadG